MTTSALAVNLEGINLAIVHAMLKRLIIALLFTSLLSHAEAQDSRPNIPAPGDENLYANLPDWRPPSFNPLNQADKPTWLATLPLLTPEEVFSDVDTVRRKT